MNGLNLNEFMTMATDSDRVIVNTDEANPTLVKAKDGISGRILSFLSNIPFLKNTSFVKAYAEKVAIENQISLLVFINALSKRFGIKSAGTALESLGSLKDKPLNARTMKNMVSVAENMYGRGEAKPLARQVVVRVWEYKSIDHPGHASVSVKNFIDPNRKKHVREHVSWWPATSSTGGTKETLFAPRRAAPLESYKADKLSEISTRTLERLNEAEQARQEIAKRRKKPVDAELNKKATFLPKAAQKKYKEGEWGISAQKVYLPMIGKNKDLSSEEKKNSKFVMFGLDEKSILKDARLVKDEAKENKIGYTLASTTQNCAAITARMLKSGGAESFVPFPSAWFNEDPNKIYAYAKSVQEEVDGLNHKADNVMKYVKEDLLQNNVTREEWGRFARAKEGAYSTTRKTIGELKNRLNKEKNAGVIQEIKENIFKHHQNHIEIIHTHFKTQVASLTQTDKRPLANLVKAMDKHKPEAKDDISILTTKAKGLVEAMDSLITSQKITTGHNQAILAAHAMLEKLEDLMAMAL